MSGQVQSKGFISATDFTCKVRNFFASNFRFKYSLSFSGWFNNHKFERVKRSLVLCTFRVNLDIRGKPKEKSCRERYVKANCMLGL